MSEVQQIGNIVDDTNIGFKNPQRGRIYSADGVSPALNTKQGGGLEPKIVCCSNKVEGDNLVAKINCIGNIYDGGQNGNVYTDSGLSPSLRSGQGVVGNGIGSSNSPKIVCACLTPDRLEKRQNGRRFKDNEEPMFTLTNQDIHGIAEVDDMSLRIRKLTPKECMRLQGVSDETTDKLIDAGISDTRLYFAAGDAVTVNVVYEVAKKMKDVMDARDAKERVND
jgi:DNA (cytosine-5)-methyltransferase 1